MTSPVPSSWQAQLPDSVAQRYTVVRQLGAGGMGEAFLATDTLLHRDVVIKRMAAHMARTEQDRRRFLSEAKRAAAINNPHVVQIHDVLDAGGEILLVLEYVDGGSLRTMWSGSLPIERFFPIALQIADGVAAAHAAGVVHCDLKPENILLTNSGQAKVLDFGLARHAPRQDAATISMPEAKFAGTPGYMAPEMVLEQKVDERADIFALGVIYYELLTGVAPFASDSLLDTLHKTVHEQPAPVTTAAAVPPQMDWILRKMLAKAPDERYANVREVITHLSACQRTVQGSPTQVAVATPTKAPQWKRVRWIAACLLILLFLGGAAVLYRRHGLAGIPQSPAGSGHYRSVAVLPFQIIGPSQDGLKAYADGVCAALTAKLSRIAEGHQLQIAAASEVRRRSLSNAAAARQQLGADLVIEGQFQKFGDSVMVTYALVDARTLQQLNSRDFETRMDDSFALEEQIVSGALELLDVQLEATERRDLTQRGTTNASAYDLFLTGSGYLREYQDPGNIERAIESFQGALLKDSHYAQANAALGRAYWRQYEDTHDPSLVSQARAACESAVRSNAALPDSHLCMGIVAAGTGQYDTAAKELQRVIDAEPSNDVALRELGSLYEKTKEPAEAEQVYRRGIAAQPHYWAGYSRLAGFYTRQQRYAEAEQQYRKAIEQAPGNALLYYSLGGVYIYEGKNQEAIAVLKKSVELQPDADGYRNLGQAYLHVRDFDNAIAAIKQAIALGARHYIYYSALGDAYYWSRTHRDEAAPAYRQSVQIALEQQRVNPKDPALHIMLAYNFAALGDQTHALEYLKRAQEEAPEDGEIMFFAARIYARLAHSREATDWLLKSIAKDYSKADIRACPDLDDLLNEPLLRRAMAK